MALALGGLQGEAGRRPSELAAKVFVRVFSVPPGAPWDQTQAAGLEARLGAPVPVAEVVYRLRRLDPWKPGRPGRFAACYIRARDVAGRHEALVVVEGREIGLTFLVGAERARRTRRAAILAASIAVIIVSAIASVLAASSLRAELFERLASIDQLQHARAREFAIHKRCDQQARALLRADMGGRRVGDLLSDLAWVARSEFPDARIEALHWRRGLVALEVHGEQPPLAQNGWRVLRAHKPVRPETWLWGYQKPPAAVSARGSGEGRRHARP